MAAMEMAEKTLETDPYNAAANHMLKEAAVAAWFPEIAVFCLETLLKANPKDTKVLDEWYPKDASGRPYIRVPERLGDPMFQVAGFVGRPARDARVAGNIQRTDLVQHDLTPEQYAALVKLTAALCRIFPKMTCDYPRDAAGKLVTTKLPDETWKAYAGVLGHYHVQTNKIDPGPALDWDRLIRGARRELGLPPTVKDVEGR